MSPSIKLQVSFQRFFDIFWHELNFSRLQRSFSFRNAHAAFSGALVRLRWNPVMFGQSATVRVNFGQASWCGTLPSQSSHHRAGRIWGCFNLWHQGNHPQRNLGCTWEIDGKLKQLKMLVIQTVLSKVIWVASSSTDSRVSNGVREMNASSVRACSSSLLGRLGRFRQKLWLTKTGSMLTVSY